MKALGFDVPKAEVVAILTEYGVTAQRLAASSAQASKASRFAAAAKQQQEPENRHPTRLLLSLTAFQQIMAERIAARDPRDEINRAFDLYDEGAKGKVTLDDLRRVAEQLGDSLEEDELISMIDEFDLDGDGALNRDEFLGIFEG